jgi:hypothetical protein
MLHWKILERNLKNMLYVLAEDALAPPSTKLPLQLALSHLQKSLILIQSSIPQNHLFQSAILALVVACLAFADAASTIVKDGKVRRVLRRRGRQRQRQGQGRQLFGNRVVLGSAPPLPFAPAPAVRFAPAPVQFAPAPVQFAPAPLQFAQHPLLQFPQHPNQFAQQPIRVVEVRQPTPVAVRANYAGPQQQVVVQQQQQQPQQQQVIQVRQQPQQQVVQVRQEQQPIVFHAPVTVAATRSVPVSLAKPIAITRSVYNAPGTNVNSPDTWNYAFETENGIKQSAVGEMKTVGDSDVVVMRGSYEYIGAEGLVYTVDWVADELGFRATAPHLPKSVESPFPEQRAAIAAQILFAEQETRTAEASAFPTF